MPVKIFFCYAHEDEALLKKLQIQLMPLQRQALIDVWHDRDISAGTEWEQEISHHLNMADIILLLVSPDFMASDYCYSIEVKRALERHQRGEAQVIPIILSHVHWQGEPLGKLQVLPTDAKPVTGASWHSLNEALFDVAEGVRIAVEKTLAKISTKATTTNLFLPSSHVASMIIPIKSREQVHQFKDSPTIFPFVPLVGFQTFELLSLIARMEQDRERQSNHEKQIAALAKYINWMMDAFTEAYRVKNAELPLNTLELLLSRNNLDYLGNYKFVIVKRNHINTANFTTLCHEVLLLGEKINDFLEGAFIVLPRILSSIFSFINAHVVLPDERLENQEVWELLVQQFSSQPHHKISNFA